MNNRLRELRLSKNLTLKQVGEGVGLAANTISRYEISNREPSLEVWKKLADFFGVTVSYLLGLSSRKQIKNRIRDVRIQKRMSQKELADKIQMTQQAISLYEQGIREPNSEIWQKLADCFDVSVPYLQGYPFAKCHWCGNEFALAAEKGKDRYFYCPYCGRSPLDFGDKRASAKTEHQDEKKEFLKLENEKDTLDDSIGFLTELIETSDNLTNVGKVELTKVVRVLYNIYYDDTDAFWKSK